MRNATPLIVAPSLPPLENRVEVLIATARLQMPFLPGVDQVSDPLATILVSFDPSEAARRSLRMLAASFVAAAPSISQAPAGADVGSWFADSLQKLEASSISIVVVLPGYSSDVEHQAVALLEDARRAGRHHLSLAVGVATTPTDWAQCGFDGFVIAEEEERDSDSLRIFAALSAMMAPGLLFPLDADDFRCALGNAEYPSRIVEATFRLTDYRFEPTSGNAGEVLRLSSGVAIMASRSLHLAPQCHIVDCVRGSIRPGAAITVIAPSGLAVELLGSPDIVRVALLCCADSNERSTTSCY